MNDYQALSLILAAVCVFGTLLLVLIGHLLAHAILWWKLQNLRLKIYDRYHGIYGSYAPEKNKLPPPKHHGDVTDRDYCLGCRREMRTESGRVCDKCGGAK